MLLNSILPIFEIANKFNFKSNHSCLHANRAVLIQGEFSTFVNDHFIPLCFLEENVRNKQLKDGRQCSFKSLPSLQPKSQCKFEMKQIYLQKIKKFILCN